jgi:pimeloyl-ACP methyl ester carboxylesterase
MSKEGKIMLFSFEGTGNQKWGGTSKRALEDLSNTTSFAWQFSELSTAPKGLKRYFPGPNVQGSNCDDILNLAIEWYDDRKRTFGASLNNQKITLVGYSRGAYIAMCLAKYFESIGKQVYFMGLFDAVSRDLSMPRRLATSCIPNNVQFCIHAARSPIIGSRNISMDRIGQTWENGSPLAGRKEFPGSHAALGGFYPDGAGPGDAPKPAYEDPKVPGRFDPQRERAAYYGAGNHVSTPAFNKKLLHRKLVGVSPAGLLPESDWYLPRPNYVVDTTADAIRKPKI